MTAAVGSTAVAASAMTLLTGGRGAGKTSRCREIVTQAQGMGWHVAGLLSPARFDGPDKVGIDVLDLRSGQSRPLARLRSRTAAATTTGTYTQRWAFDDSAVAWGNQMLQQAIPCDLLVVDELGPLELERDAGWTQAITTINTRAYRWALVVVRPELVSIALGRWPQAVVVEVADPAAREQLRRLLFAET